MVHPHWRISLLLHKCILMKEENETLPKNIGEVLTTIRMWQEGMPLTFMAEIKDACTCPACNVVGCMHACNVIACM